MIDRQNKWIERHSTLIFVTLSVVLVIMMLLVVVHPLELFTSHDAPFQVMAACLGAIVTALITAMLLNSQTKQQEKLQEASKEQELDRAKKTEQYKEKLRIYQGFLDELYTVVKDRDLTTEEKISMQFKTAILSMHTESTHIEKISENVKDVLMCMCAPKKSYDVKKLQESLFNIVYQFRKELYGLEINDNSDALNNTLLNFVDAYNGIESAEMQESAITDDSSFLWQKARERWENDKKWEVIIDGETIVIKRKGDRIIELQFGFWKGHYYIQAKYEPFGEFSQAMKWKYGGSKTYSTWWMHIKTPAFFDLKEGEFWSKFQESESMQRELVDWFDKLIAETNDWDVLADRHNALMNLLGDDRQKYEKQGWKFWIWAHPTDGKCNVCDSHIKDEGEPFIDIVSENGQIVIRLGNRENKAVKQREIASRLGLPTDNIVKDDDRTDYYRFNEGVSDEDVMAKVAELIEKISRR
ncbi:MAG: hypothetical protein IKJ40_00805 [Bacteroidales bacterium]|nr:hypothetical protein [Bacteroidales bacterium]